jgi:hypothetical protein
MVLAASGCTAHSPPAPQPTYPPTEASPSTNSPSLPPLEELEASPPAGSLVAALTGRGRREISLTAFSPPQSNVALRVACLGTGGVRVTNLAGGLILNVAGCTGTSIYGAKWTGSADDDLLSVSADDGTDWVLAIWDQPTGT